MLIFSLIFLFSSLISLIISNQEIFEKNCNLLKYSNKSPQTILPSKIKQKQIKNEIILKYYEEGLKECNEYYKENYLNLLNEKISPFLLNHFPNGRNTLCRGNAMFLQATGLLIWSFGPINECPTYSDCWYGFLTCGNFQQDKLTGIFDSGYSSTQKLAQKRTFKSWSMKSLDIETRVVGLETLAPSLGYIDLKVNGKDVEVILAQYTLTIPGDYIIEMRLQGLYPGVLYEWSNHDILRGAELYHSIFLGGTEARCPAYNNCGSFYTPACDMKSFVGKSPYNMKSIDKSSNCFNSIKNLPKLPYCTNGNHVGRWIKVPEKVLDVCGSAKYEKELKDEHLRQAGKRQDFGRYATIVTEYNHHTQTIDEKKIWEVIFGRNQQGNQSTNIYLETLSRYSGGNVCVLTDIEVLPTPLEGKLEIFAPYECKYRLMSSQEGIRCLEDKGINMATFHGDSMSRNIYAAFMDIMGVSGISPEQLKQLMRSGLKNFSQTNNGFTVSEIYTWDVIDKSIDTIQPPLYPPVYVTNAAFAHAILDDLLAFSRVMNTTRLVQFWREYKSQHSSSDQNNNNNNNNLVKRIYQSASAMHGKRNTGYQWMNEAFRRQNEINRQIFIDELNFLDFDEWILTAAKPEFVDGWHYHSVPLSMNAMILLNMMCNS